MRSIIIFIHAKKGEITKFLDEKYVQNGEKYLYKWIGYNGNVYIRIYEEFRSDMDVEEISEIVNRIGEFTALIIDISGSIKGDKEVLFICKDILNKYNGFAQDDYTEYLWSLPEILNETMIDGFKFFDYYRRYKSAQQGDAPEPVS